jgi:hypothetical protein
VIAVVESVECASCGGRHNLCVAPDNYSPGALYEYVCPRTNELIRVTPNKSPCRSDACPSRTVYAKRVEG